MEERLLHTYMSWWILQKEKITNNFNFVQKSYQPVLDIIDSRWDLQLHIPLHSAAYYLNPHYHYSANFKVGCGAGNTIFPLITTYPIFLFMPVIFHHVLKTWLRKGSVATIKRSVKTFMLTGNGTALCPSHIQVKFS